ncbi:MAG: DUF1998 domain-containing protein, partial [Deltaproteobacteria bacterium]|nr:DUF1998 domain-containing protein [Deltaproteobacteria bacterium]
QDRVDLELRTAAFLTRTADGLYGFSHKSFREFFLARHLLRALRQGVEALTAALNTAPLTPECVAFLADLMIEDGEEMIGLPEIRKCLAGLIQEGRLLETDDGVGYVSRSRHPQREVDLRGAGSEFSIHDVSTGELIGSMDRHRAWHEAHPGAVYVHQGRTHVVQDLDVDSATILVEADDPKHYTRALSAKTTRILRTLESRALGSTSVHLGRVLITERVTGYEKRSTRTGRLVGREDLDLPPLEFETEGLWVIVPEAIQSKLERDMLHFMGGIHALEHALIAMMPLFVLTDRNDLGGISVPCHDQLGQAAVFVYDGVPGGAGLTRAGFAKAREILEHTLEAVSRCPCTFGCPSCVHSPRCGSGNRPLDKEAAQAIMRGMLAPGTAVQFSEVAIPENEPEIPAPSKAVSRIRFGVFDLETRHSAHEVGGWGRPEAMGVSCAVLYDSGPDRFTTYMAEDIPALVEDLRSLDLVVGFNIIRFDYRVLQGYSQFPFRDLPTLDILAKVQERLGYRLSLGHLAQYTLNAAKSADGLQALKWWKQGRIREIVEYCTQDVAVTRDLYLHGRDKGHLVFQNKAGLQVSLPVSW